MEYIAHRGCADQFPENTLHAVRSVINSVDRIELDVVQCGSGELILFHDETTAHRTDGSYIVSETEYSTLKELHVLDTKENIPLLRSALEEIPKTVDVQLDLKQHGIASATGQAVEDYAHDIYVCATETDILQEVKNEPWNADLGFVSFPHFQYEDIDPKSISEAEIDDVIHTAVNSGCSFIEIPQELCIDTSIIQKAQHAGLQAVAWTIRSKTQLKAMESASADAVMIDRIDIFD